MFLPIGDDSLPERRVFAWATYAIVLINSLVYLGFTLPGSQVPANPQDPALEAYLNDLEHEHMTAWVGRMHEISQTDVWLYTYGFHGNKPQLLSLLTAMFLHASFWHLLGNLLVLLIFSRNVERVLGPWRFVWLYLASGIAAALFYTLLQNDSALPMVGASGAIGGVLGYYFWTFPNNRIRVMVWFFVFIRVVQLPARLLLGVYMVLQNVVPLCLGDESAQVAYSAHLGGFLMGLLTAWILPPTEDDQQVPVNLRSSRWQVPGQLVPTTSLPPAVVSATQVPTSGADPLREAVMAGQSAVAWLQLQQLQPAQLAAVGDDTLLQLADALVSAHGYQAAKQVLALLQRREQSHLRSFALLRSAWVDMSLGQISEGKRTLTKLLQENPPWAIREQAERLLRES